jgi:hypothetical protein
MSRIIQNSISINTESNRCNFAPADFFSRQALEFSAQLLQQNHSGLANAIQKALNQITIAPYALTQPAHTGEMVFNAQLLDALPIHTLGKIVEALTAVGEHALQSPKNKTQPATKLRELIDDWIQLTEWVLQRSHNDQRAAN